MNTQDHRRFDRQSSRPIGAPSMRPDLGLAGRPHRHQRHAVPGQPEIGIEHFGSLYRLKITRQGKLILNK